MEPITPGFGLGLACYIMSLGLVGLPPAERDAKLINCPSEKAFFYTEWTAKADNPKGEKGLVGLWNDEEVTEFRKHLRTIGKQIVLKQAAEKGIKAQTEAGLNLFEVCSSHAGCIYGRAEGAAAQMGPEKILESARVTWVVAAGDKADSLAGSLKTILKDLPGFKGTFKMETIEIGGPMPVNLHRHESYFIVAYGKDAVDQAVKGLKGTSNGLADSANFKDNMKMALMETPAMVSFLNIQAIKKEAKTGLGVMSGVMNLALELAGIDQASAVAFAIGIDDTGNAIAKKYFATGGKTAGLLSLAGGRSIKPGDLQVIPYDARFVIACSVDVTKVVTEVRSVAKRLSKGMFPGIDAQIETLIDAVKVQTGLDLDKDILPALGNLWTVYDSPSQGSFFFSGAVGTIEIGDGDKGKLVFDKILTLIKESLPPEQGNEFQRWGMKLKKQQFDAVDIHYVSSYGGDNPFAPAICLSGKNIIIALQPQFVKAHLRAAKGKKQFPAKLKSLGKAPEGDVVMFCYSDTPAVVRGLYPMLPWLASAAAGPLNKEGVKFDPFLFPSPRAVLPYIAPNVETLTRTEKGLLYVAKGTIPTPLVGLVVGPAAAAGVAAVGQRSTGTFEVIGEELPTEEAPRVRPRKFDAPKE